MHWDLLTSGIFRRSLARLGSVLNRAAIAPDSDLSDTCSEDTYLQFIETMAQALDARDPYTAGHSIRVGAYADAIARALRLPPADIATLRIGAQLHDIGKIGVSDAVLQKRGRLTPDEFERIKLHPQIGRRILEKVARFDSLLPIVELHHENYDGTGYPFGLSGENIPLFARIVRVADTFDSMMTDRNYRPALSLSAAIEQLRKYSGTHFDPLIAATMIDLVHQGKHEVLQPSANHASLQPA